MELIIASNNKDKIKEIRSILNENIKKLSLNDIGFKDDIIENGNSFEENAYIKAKTIYDKYHLPVLADDSGLQVKALNGMPGIHSHRYAGENASYDDNNKLLLKNMENVKDRSASFICVMCLIIDDKTYYAKGILDGKISDKRIGDNGFGYDPYFLIDQTNTLASISSKKKNEISHRKKALIKIGEILDEYLNNVR